MQPVKHLPGVTVLEGRRRKTIADSFSEFMGTALGTALGLGLFLLLAAVVGTQEYALMGR